MLTGTVNIAVFAAFQCVDAQRSGIHGELERVRLPDRGKSGNVDGKNGKVRGNRGNGNGNVFAALPAEGLGCVHCAHLSR